MYATKKWRLCLINQVFCVDLSGFNFFITKAHVARIFYKSIVGFYSATGLIHVVDKSMAVQKKKTFELKVTVGYLKGSPARLFDAVKF